MTNKNKIFEKIIIKVTKEVAVLERAMKSAHEDATHSETKQEGKYDTRAIEAGYLAGAQAERARILKSNLDLLIKLKDSNLPKSGKAKIGSCVCLENEDNPGDKRYYVIIPLIAGVEVEIDGKTYMSLTPESALGKKLIGRAVEDNLVLENFNSTRHMRILDIF